METFDYESQFDRLKKDVIRSFEKALDVQAAQTGRRLQATRVWVEDNRDPGDLDTQKEAVRKDQTWGVPVYASLKMTDRKTGEVISTVEKLKVATLPKGTNLGSFIVDGKHYQVQNQLRRKPGIYVTEKENHELKTEVNVAGRPFGIEYDPETQVFKMSMGQKMSNLYPILSRLGISDSMLAKAWGQDVLDQNKAASAKDKKSIQRAAQYFRNKVYESPETAAEALREYFDEETALRPEVTKRTVGKEFSKVTPEALVFGSKELFRANLGERGSDDRQALEYKKALGMSDLMRERLIQESGELAGKLSEFRKKIHRRLNNRKAPPTDVRRLVSSNEFTPVFTTFFSQSALANTTDQTNPLNMLNGMSKITILGEGGASEDRIRSEERGVHPSHLGFVDPIHTPDSGRIGTVMNLPVGVGKDGEDLKTRVLDPRSGKVRHVSPSDMRDMVVAFPDQYKHKDRAFTDEKVKAIVNGQTQLVDASKVDAVFANPKQAFSISSNTIPFLPSAGGVRAQMATKMLEQALPLIHEQGPDGIWRGREAPLVQVGLGRTTMEDSIGEGFSIRALEEGVVDKVTAKAITIKTKDGEVQQALYNNLPLNKSSFLHASPTVKPGDKVAKGTVIADSNFTDKGSLAIGTNLRAAYIPYKGYNFEDGIVITENAAKKLTSEHMHQYAASVGKTEKLSLEDYVAWRPTDLTLEQQQKLDAAGVIRKGQVVQKGDPLWVGTRENRYDPEYIAMKKLAPNLKPVRPYKEEWTSDYEGEVVDVVRTTGGVKVFVKTKEPAQIGDKLTNRHGAKGIITKIISDGEAPYTQDGAPVDILLNPHGIVTRINPSQILETAAGKLAEKAGKPFVVENFSGEDYARTVRDQLQKAGLSDTEALFDPHTKETLGEVLVGPQYVLKLSKQATDQFSSRSDGKYDVHQSPLKGGEDGAKALDLLTFYSMLSHGSRANLREMATYKATKNPQFWHWLSAGSQSGLVKPPPEPTFAYRQFEAYLKAAGVDVQRKGSKMVLAPVTDRETAKLSSGQVQEPIFVRAKDLKHESGGLMDPVIFGSNHDRWGHYELAEPIPNPIFEKPIKTLLGMKEKVFQSVVRGERFYDPETGEWNDRAGLTGGAAIKHLLSQVDVDQQLTEWTDRAKTAKTETKLDEANKHLKYLHALKKWNVRPEEAYVQSKVPVLPPQFRPIVELEDGTLSNAGLNSLYRDIGLINQELKWQDEVSFMPETIKADLRQNLYEGVKALAGLTSPIPRAVDPVSRRPKGILDQISGSQPKKGFFQEHVLQRKQNLVGRGTIIPEPKLGVDEVGLPEEMSWDLFKPFVIRRLVTAAGKTPLQAEEEVRTRTPLARANLEAEMSEHPVMLNRAPSLHKFSIMAAMPKLTDGKAVKIPPLIVKGFNADFDGDAMTIHVPVLPDAIEEARNMLPSKNLYNPGTGGIMLQPQNEAALGLYMMSQDPERRKEILKELPVDLQAKYESRPFNKATIRDLMKDLAVALPADHGKVIDRLKQMGDNHTYKTGFTVGLKDLLPDIPEKAGIFAAANAEIRQLDFSDPKQKEQARGILGMANEALDKAVAKSLGDHPNSFDLMVRSGARGNMGQLKQIVASPFLASEHNGEMSPIPIMRSFSEGLPFSDYWGTLYGARAVAVDKQLQTSKPGAFNKDIMASAITNVISDADCGTREGIKLGLDTRDVEDRFLAKDIRVNGTVIASAGDPVTSGLMNTLRDRLKGPDRIIEVRSPLTCKKPKGTCARCYGLTEDGQLPEIGANVGATSGQALSEPLTQMTLQTFHSGGAVGSRGIVSGYEKIDKLFKMPEIKRGKATLAESAGKIESVADAAGGAGKVVKISGSKKEHFIPQALFDAGMIRVGRAVEAGDILSQGLVQPQELVKLKGMKAAQEYISDQIQESYASQGVNLKRRAVETVVRSVANTTKIIDPGESGFLPGDIAPWTAVEHYKAQRFGKKPLNEALGMSLQEDVPGVKKGAAIDEKVVRALERLGRHDVEVGPAPIIDEPFLKGIEQIPMLRGDWMSQMGYRKLTQAIVEGAAKSMESDIHNYAPVPAFAYGAEFGEAPAGKSRKEGVY